MDQKGTSNTIFTNWSFNGQLLQEQENECYSHHNCLCITTL